MPRPCKLLIIYRYLSQNVNCKLYIKLVELVRTWYGACTEEVPTDRHRLFIHEWVRNLRYCLFYLHVSQVSARIFSELDRNLIGR